jgi:hypothetical protein
MIVRPCRVSGCVVAACSAVQGKFGMGQPPACGAQTSQLVEAERKINCPTLHARSSRSDGAFQMTIYRPRGDTTAARPASTTLMARDTAARLPANLKFFYGLS